MFQTETSQPSDIKNNNFATGNISGVLATKKKKISSGITTPSDEIQA